jgi:hypothetical protein
MHDRYYAALYLRNADSQRYDSLKTELSNDFGKGRNEYPTTITEAHQLLLKRAPPPKKQPPVSTNQRGGRGNPGGRGANPGRGGGTGGSPGRGATTGAPGQTPGRGTANPSAVVGKTFV